MFSRPPPRPNAQQKAQARALVKKQNQAKTAADKKISKLAKKLEKLEMKRRVREEEGRVKAERKAAGLLEPCITGDPIFPPEIFERILSHLLPITTHHVPLAPTRAHPHSIINNLFRLFRVSKQFNTLVKPKFFAHLRVTSERQWNWLWRKGGGLIDQEGTPKEVTRFIAKITIVEERRQGNWRKFDVKPAPRGTDLRGGEGARATYGNHAAPGTMNLQAPVHVGFNPAINGPGPAHNPFANNHPIAHPAHPQHPHPYAHHANNQNHQGPPRPPPASTIATDDSWTRLTQPAKLMGGQTNEKLSLHLLECKSPFRTKILAHGLSHLRPSKLHIEGLVGTPSTAFASLQSGINFTNVTQLSFSKVEMTTEFYASLMEMLPRMNKIPEKTFRLILAFDQDTSKFENRRRPQPSPGYGMSHIDANLKDVWRPVPFLVFLDGLHRDAYLAQIKCVWMRRVVGKFLPAQQYFDATGFYKLINKELDNFDKEKQKYLRAPVQATNNGGGGGGLINLVNQAAQFPNAVLFDPEELFAMGIVPGAFPPPGPPPPAVPPAITTFLENCTNEYWEEEERRPAFVKWAAAKVYSYPKSFKGYVE